MAVTHLKQAEKTAASGEGDVRETVRRVLDEIEAGGDANQPALPKARMTEVPHPFRDQ